jgi:hypothetical protein
MVSEVCVTDAGLTGTARSVRSAGLRRPRPPSVGGWTARSAPAGLVVISFVVYYYLHTTHAPRWWTTPSVFVLKKNYSLRV